jgi:hypothetical protein
VVTAASCVPVSSRMTTSPWSCGVELPSEEARTGPPRQVSARGAEGVDRRAVDPRGVDQASDDQLARHRHPGFGALGARRPPRRRRHCASIAAGITGAVRSRRDEVPHTSRLGHVPLLSGPGARRGAGPAAAVPWTTPGHPHPFSSSSRRQAPDDRWETPGSRRGRQTPPCGLLRLTGSPAVPRLRARRRVGASARLRVGTSARRRACAHVGTSARLRVGTSARRHVGTPARRHVGTSARRHVGTSARRHVGTSALDPGHPRRVDERAPAPDRGPAPGTAPGRALRRRPPDGRWVGSQRRGTGPHLTAARGRGMASQKAARGDIGTEQGRQHPCDR